MRKHWPSALSEGSYVDLRVVSRQTVRDLFCFHKKSIGMTVRPYSGLLITAGN